MAKLFGGIFAAGVLALSSLPSQAATITFDSLATGPIGPSYTTQGVTFTTDASSGLYILPAPQAGAGQALISTADFSSFFAIRADIAGGTDFVSVDLGDLGFDADAIFLDVYDAANVLLGSASYGIPEGVAGYFTLSANQANIAYAIFGSVGVQGSSVYADNFTFTSSAVPEPASWAMMIGGFGVAGGAMRVRRRSVAYA